MNTNEPTDLHDWISFSEAARRLPSNQRGKRVHVATLYRWARKHGWKIMKRNGYSFVRWSDIVAMHGIEEQYVPRKRPRVFEQIIQQRQTERILREMGMGD